MITIEPAETEKHYQEIRLLFDEYQKFLNVDLYFQNFNEEVSNLPGKYGPPEGRLFLASVNSKTIGCIALNYFFHV